MASHQHSKSSRARKTVNARWRARLDVVGRSAARAIAEPLERRMLLSLTPAGPEFRVNTFTTDSQNASAVGMDGDGDFVVVWNSLNQDGSGLGVYAQRYNAAGVAQGAEFRVNSFTTNGQGVPAIGMDADGDFVVAWHSDGQDGSGLGIFAQRFNGAGVPQGAEFRVNSFTAGQQAASAIGMDADGDFVVAWQSADQDGSGSGIYAQRYNYAGVPQGGEFRVNSFTTDDEFSPTVGMDADGDFVVAWESVGQDGSSYGVFAKRFNAAGVPQGAEFRVNSFTAGIQNGAKVAIDLSGDFIIAWQSDLQDGSQYGIYAQRYNAAGVAQGVEFRVNSFTTSLQGSPTLATDADGDFIITWGSSGQDGSGHGTYARAYNALGVPQGSEFKVNTFTTGNQFIPGVAMDHDGDCVIAWQSSGQDGSSNGIYAQRYNESTETAGPVIAGVFVNGARAFPYGVVPGPTAQVVVSFSEDVGGPNGVANIPNWRVAHYDGTTTSSVPILGINYGFNTAANRFQATLHFSNSFASGNLQIIALDASRDPAGNALDGDFDGSPGGSFARTFGIGPAPRGGQFRVNGATVAGQSPAIGLDDVGDSVVAWAGSGTGDSFGVFAQRYNAAGVAQGAAFRVNSFTTSTQGVPAIGIDVDGDFVVAWSSNSQDGSEDGVYAQRFNAAGVAQGGEFRVNAFTGGDQSVPAVAMDADGDFVVAWHSVGQDGSSFGIYAQRYDAAGVPQGGEFRVNLFTTNCQVLPAIGADADGNFVIAWCSASQDFGSYGVYARRYNAAGVAQGGEFRINSFSTDRQQDPAIGMNDDGDFVVAWQSSLQDGSGSGVYAQRYDASGVPQGAEFHVNTFTAGDQESPDVAMNADGDIVVSWESDGQDGSGFGIHAQRFNGGGVRVGSEFRVNSFIADHQLFPAIGMDEDGDFVITWESSDFGIYAQRYSPGATPVVATLSDSPDPTSSGTPAVTLTAGGVADSDGSATRVSFYRESNGIDGLQVGIDSDTLVGTDTLGGNGWSSVASTAGLAPGTYTYWAQATDDTGYVGAPASTTNTVIPAPPAVTNSSFNFATLPQRLSFTFNQNVGPSLGLNDIVVQQLPAGPTITPSAVSFDTATNTATFTFNAPIPDGRFRARLIASGISGPGGQLPADHTFEFTFLRGDANGDGAVNLGDFNILAANFGQSPRDFTQGDFDYSGTVNLADFNILASRFGQVSALEFRVNSFTTGDQWSPAIAMDADRNFVVAWN